MITSLATESIEAVILNGPRRGQIIALPENEAHALPTEEEKRLLLVFCEQVDIMADKVSEMRGRVERISATLERIGDTDGSGQ